METIQQEDWKYFIRAIFAIVEFEIIDLHLINGSSEAEGKVFYDNQWWTVCDDRFNTNEGAVACE